MCGASTAPPAQYICVTTAAPDLGEHFAARGFYLRKMLLPNFAVIEKIGGKNDFQWILKIESTNCVCSDAIVLSFSESWESSTEYSLFTPGTINKTY